MRLNFRWCLLAVAFAAAPLHAERTLSAAEFRDKLEGGWMGEIAGVCWGAPTEFVWQGKPIPDADVPEWKPAKINEGFWQDDLYVEIPFLDAMEKHGVNCGFSAFGQAFRDTKFDLWHANEAGRSNLRRGIAAPYSGHYRFNRHADDIDWQIEADFAGLICPAQENAAIDIAWRAGHVMNYGDGVYGGVFMAAMHAKAYTAKSIAEIAEAGRLSVPKGSGFREMVDDVIAWHRENPADWRYAWTRLENKWAQGDRCPDGIGKPFNIDAKINGAYVLIGLLYGEGDMERTMRIAMQCGQDSDCNPSSAGGILGSWLGYARIPVKFRTGFDRTAKFSYTDDTLDDCIEKSARLARKVLVMNGGRIVGKGTDELWKIPEAPIVAPILEQWPAQAGPAPAVHASASVKGRQVSFAATGSGGRGKLAYQWFFGDLSFADGAAPHHAYRHPGTYQALCYVTDGTGNTSWKAVPVVIAGR